ncbi:MAG: MOSC domain-containing protein [Bacteroidia bacterium]|nr:MOSC domain-containing protein [Bacteroidia bacterium]
MKPSIQELMDTLPQKGELLWIGLRPERRAVLEAVETANISIEDGLIGDHYTGKRNVNRQITLIQQEHLLAVASMLGRDVVDPQLTRRNLVIKGINLLALKDKQFQIGEVILEGTGLCHPCSRMEENLGPGGYNAMRGHGGLTAKVIRGGKIHLSDEVVMLSNKTEEAPT